MLFRCTLKYEPPLSEFRNGDLVRALFLHTGTVNKSYKMTSIIGPDNLFFLFILSGLNLFNFDFHRGKRLLYYKICLLEFLR